MNVSKQTLVIATRTMTIAHISARTLSTVTVTKWKGEKKSKTTHNHIDLCHCNVTLLEKKNLFGFALFSFAAHKFQFFTTIHLSEAMICTNTQVVVMLCIPWIHFFSLSLFRQVFWLFSHMNQNILDRNWIRSTVRFTHKCCNSFWKFPFCSLSCMKTNNGDCDFNALICFAVDANRLLWSVAKQPQICWWLSIGVHDPDLKVQKEEKTTKKDTCST